MIGQRSHGGKRSRRVFPVVAALNVVAFVTAGATTAQPRIDESYHLRIASWNLSDAAETGGIVRDKPNKKSWRNTFGAERRVAAKPKFAGDRLKADIVLLQGVKSVREVRQIFPARDWKLILSRQLLKLSNGRIGQDSNFAGEQTITAVAVRYQLRLRVTALEHLTGLDDAKAELADQVTRDPRGARTDTSTGEENVDGGRNTAPQQAQGPGNETQRERFPDGLAVRVARSGSVIWVVSAVMPSRCRSSPDTCGPAERLKEWADGKRAKGFGVVMGGKLDGTLRQAGSTSVCADQEIVADRALQAETGADTVAGCIAFADIEGS